MPKQEVYQNKKESLKLSFLNMMCFDYANQTFQGILDKIKTNPMV